MALPAPRLIDATSLPPAYLLGAVVALMGYSAMHRRWTIEDLGRLVTPPILLRQYLAFERGGELVAWCSWAMMNDLAAHGFSTGQRRFEVEDWHSGPSPWVVDVVAPHGDAMAVARTLRTHLIARAEAEDWPVRTCRWARRRADGTIRRNGSLAHAS